MDNSGASTGAAHPQFLPGFLPTPAKVTFLVQRISDRYIRARWWTLVRYESGSLNNLLIHFTTMGTPDFLHKEAQTPLCELYTAAGAVCKLSTNCEQVVQAARDSFLPVNGASLKADFSVRIWVNEQHMAFPPWPKPYVRGLDQLVFAGFDSGSCLVANLRTKTVAGRFSLGMGRDVAYWKTVIFPIVLTIVGASVGIAELHCACVANNDSGLLLVGPSGAGKSTLALMLSQIGYGFLSDDRTFCSYANGEVQAWGLATRLKLRLEATQWFKELAAMSGARNGDVWIEPESAGIRRVSRCRPRYLIFLERQKTSCFRSRQLSVDEAAQRLETDLMAELPDRIVKRSNLIRRLAQAQCSLLEYGGSPSVIAERICSELVRW
jgi:hypothetical protein